ncbi:hypothetical protein BHECKSOX_1106 [Bathymodiolus heckerae thiotrophic gill symbiont]|nr:hypothetical protein BHECKSOX_1106 [Bathymodiolus heckerae thiotrophic gill symbiont]
MKVGGSSNFEAKLAGYRHTNGIFRSRGETTDLWSSTGSGGYAHRRYLYVNDARVVRRLLNKAYGFSVRCLKD